MASPHSQYARTPRDLVAVVAVQLSERFVLKAYSACSLERAERVTAPAMSLYVLSLRPLSNLRGPRIDKDEACELFEDAVLAVDGAAELIEVGVRRWRRSQRPCRARRRPWATFARPLRSATSASCRSGSVSLSGGFVVTLESVPMTPNADATRCRPIGAGPVRDPVRGEKARAQQSCCGSRRRL